MMDTVLASVPRKPGRPRILEQKRAVSAWMSPAEHDRLIQLANRREQSVSQTLIDIVRTQLRSIGQLTVFGIPFIIPAL